MNTLAGKDFFLGLIRHGVVAILGCLFAIALYNVWALEGRWFYIVIIAIGMVAVACIAISWFSQLLMMMLMFCFTLAGFNKWLFIDFLDKDQAANQAYAGLISIGLYDFLLLGLYMSWFYRIFLTREQRLPALHSMDVWVLALVITYLISIPGSIEPILGWFSLAHLLKYVALYFYVSRNFQYRHVKWFLAAMIFAIFINTLLGSYQKYTGNLVGIALDKGAGSSELNTIYEVYKLDTTRATGTTYDSHSLGMLMGMAFEFTFILLFWPKMKTALIWVTCITMGMAVLALFFCYSRTAWLSTLIATTTLVGIIFFRWREPKVLFVLALGVLASLIASPWLFDYIYDRFQRGTIEVFGYRYDQWVFAIKVWMEGPFFGVGVGNYMETMKTIEDFGNASPLPVHNMYIWTLCDIGIFGFIAFFGMILSAMRRLWVISGDNQTLTSCLSLAIVMSLFIFCLDGITNPIFREPMVYTLFWFFMAFAVVFPEFHQREKDGTLKPDTELTERIRS